MKKSEKIIKIENFGKRKKMEMKNWKIKKFKKNKSKNLKKSKIIFKAHLFLYPFHS